MRVLVLGGTQFIGPCVVRRLHALGCAVGVFHRGLAEADLPSGVTHLHGDRARLAECAAPLHAFAPEVVLDTRALTEADATAVVRAFRGAARRLVVLSSGDVYRAFGRVQGVESGPPEPVPLSEDAPPRPSIPSVSTIPPKTPDLPRWVRRPSIDSIDRP
jgi:nucleoside-diphosphate-sugar epimerase